MPHLLFRRHLPGGHCMNTRFKMPSGQLGKTYVPIGDLRRKGETLSVSVALAAVLKFAVADS